MESNLQKLRALLLPPSSPCRCRDERRRCWGVDWRPSRTCRATSRNVFAGPGKVKSNIKYYNLVREIYSSSRAVARCGCAPGENKILRPPPTKFFLCVGGGGVQTKICGKMRPSSFKFAPPYYPNWLNLRPSSTCAPGDRPLRPALATALIRNLLQSKETHYSRV